MGKNEDKTRLSDQSHFVIKHFLVVLIQLFFIKNFQFEFSSFRGGGINEKPLNLFVKSARFSLPDQLKPLKPNFLIALLAYC